SRPDSPSSRQDQTVVVLGRLSNASFRDRPGIGRSLERSPTRGFHRSPREQAVKSVLDRPGPLQPLRAIAFRGGRDGTNADPAPPASHNRSAPTGPRPARASIVSREPRTPIA